MTSTQEVLIQIAIGIVALALAVLIGYAEVKARREANEKAKYGCVRGHVEYSCGDGSKPIEKYICEEKSAEAP